MAHEIETMAFAHETPWHGLGARVEADLSEDEFMRRAGLDWTVEKRPLTAEGGISVPSHRALIRSSDDKVLSVVGKDWNPVQNRDAFRFFKSFVESGEATMETAGSLRGGLMVWGLANLNTGFTLPGGDTVKGYILLANPHESGKSVLARVTPVRVVCANTLAIATRGTAKFEARFSHRTEFRPDEAREAMGLAREEFHEFEKDAAVLQTVILGREDAIRILAPIYQPDHDVADLVKHPNLWNPTMDSIWHCAIKAPGATPGTAWGLLNGATYWANHVANSNPDKRLASAWTGREQLRQNRLMDNLLKLAA